MSSQNSQTSIQIRRLQPSDVASLSGVYTICFLDNPAYCYLFPNFPSEKLQRALHWLFTLRLKALLQFNIPYYVAVDGDQLVGGAGCIPHSRKPSLLALLASGFLWWPFYWGLGSFLRGFIMTLMIDYVERVHTPTTQAQLTMVAVSPSHQRMGVGRKLLDSILHDIELKDMNIGLSTQKKNNLKFYSKFGFYHVKDVKVLGIDGYIMQRTVIQSKN